ncbi:ParB/RepB/Spo0J family partition protein [Nocardioides sp. JQ2195]|uniref:ParB/RepB/Spo0J family partition protein n=1 Tax=Nocardioides sp. JQ2195 TaxID=2592334 RepID=UPI00143E5075|nr:ParB/RepB/Spo0J family partition protein [Nocardioides sp. JQ2195]QIX28508.1 ParB/RepB/Spo0J family partition protein [Nocardioides sp. JQ2195]
MNQKQTQRRGLGRGLGALIPTSPVVEEPEARRDDHASDAASSSSSYATPLRSGGATPTNGSDRAASTSSSAPAADPSAAADGQDVAPADSVEEPALVAGAYFAELPLTSITANARQPRQVFEEEAMAELVHSIREVGLLQPVVVRRLAQDDAKGEPAYELIMGERRWRASQEAGLDVIPAIVRQTDDNDMLRDALLENLHRSQLNPLEEAAAYGQMLEDFECTHEELASRIGRSRPQISNTLRLLKLSPAVQRRVAAGVLSAGHARSLLAVENPDIQDRLAQRVVSEGISVRGLEEIVAVGDHGGKGPRTQRSKPSAPGLSELADRLSDRLETRVKVDLGRSKGKITVEFASMEDLRRIMDIMDPRNRSDRPI